MGEESDLQARIFALEGEFHALDERYSGHQLSASGTNKQRSKTESKHYWDMIWARLQHQFDLRD